MNDWTISEAAKHPDATAWVVVHTPPHGRPVIARFTSEVGAMEYHERHAGPHSVVIPPLSAHAKAY